MLTIDEFNKICKLARLHIEESNVEPFLVKLNSIFEWIQQLQDINTSDVKIHNVHANSTQTERDDIVITQNCREDVLSNTKFKKFDMFSVPKVVE